MVYTNNYQAYFSYTRIRFMYIKEYIIIEKLEVENKNIQIYIVIYGKKVILYYNKNVSILGQRH